MQNGSGPTDDAHAERAQANRAVNLITKTVRGAFWTILSGTGARLIGIIGTLAVTHYLNPSEYGEVSLAALVTLNANVFANCGLSQYIASKPDAGRRAVFHATFYFIVLGVVALGGAVFFAGPFGRFINAPGIIKFLPGLALAALIDRFCTIQDRIQLRDMRFRSVGVQRSLGELVYSAASVGLAAFFPGTIFGGGYALVWASLGRAVIRLITLSATTPWREWLEPHGITVAQSREFFRFGLPMSIATIAGFGSQKFDNYVFSHYFGQAAYGFYNLAYNFADIPASLIGETVGDVLVPSLARMEGERRKEALLLAMRILVLLVTPLALGLAMVAPTLVKLAFTERYSGITPTLRILAMFSIPRTIGWIGSAYLQVRNEPRLIMILEIGRMLGIVILMNAFVLLGLRFFGPEHAVLMACVSVVSVFALSGVSYMWAIRKVDGVPLITQILPLFPPILASVPMLFAVYAVRHLMYRLVPFVLIPGASFGSRVVILAPRLIVEMVVGAVAFVPSALLLAPGPAREFIKLIRESADRRRKGGDDAETPSVAAP